MAYGVNPVSLPKPTPPRKHVAEVSAPIAALPPPPPAPKPPPPPAPKVKKKFEYLSESDDDAPPAPPAPSAPYERPVFKCSVCGKTMKFKETLDMHMRAHEAKEKTKKLIKEMGSAAYHKMIAEKNKEKELFGGWLHTWKEKNI